MHARSGGDLEIMGLLQGKVEPHTFIIMDAFALPVVGTETRVNPGAESAEYIICYLELIKQVGKTENPIGWYHSHPGYGCWLSGIDVTTQMTYQAYNEPWLALVVDPKRTINSNKVEVGAFRTYPKDYKPPDAPASEYQSVPLEKIEDFGAYANQYYQLETSFFKSGLDAHLLELLWNKYWVNALASSPILANRDYTSRQLQDLAEKLEGVDTQLAHGSRMGFLGGGAAGAGEKKGEASGLAKVAKECARPCCEQSYGLMTQLVKHTLFNRTLAAAAGPSATASPLSPPPSSNG
jgi:COP9 signalosome complex subunit 5